jgi:hypothetical protein
MIVQPIVEGQGEESAVPVLLRRLAAEAQAWDVQVARPHRRRRAQLVKRDSLQTAVSVARLTPACGGILILFDADDDCPKELAPVLAGWAREAAAGTPCAIVLANREYEAWFLAGVESLRGRVGIREDATAPADPEAARDAKGALEQHMRPGTGYSPTVDQAPLTAALDLASAYQRCRSFRRLVHAFGGLLGSTRRPWPPEGWIAR